MKPIQILIADEHCLVRHALRHQFAQIPDIDNVVEANTLDEVLHTVQNEMPDIAIIDMEMIDHTEASIQQLSDLCSDVRVIFLSTQDWDSYLAFAWFVGACAFVCKTKVFMELVQIVHECASNRSAFTTVQHRRIRAWQLETGAKLQTLTSRQKDVLKLLILGYTNLEIGQALVITVKTVESHINQIFTKLEVDSRRGVITWMNERHVSVIWN